MKKRILTAVIIMLMTMPTLLSGCNKPAVVVNNISFWSAPNSQKVLRDVSYADKGDKLLYFELAKDEDEGAQIIITPDKNVSSYTASISDMTSGSNKISKDNFTIYAQKYINIKYNSSLVGNFPLGYYPDAMVPLNAIVSAKENTIKANQNQGLWITVKTNSSVVAGDYTGQFTINCDGKEEIIPVNVRIWDFLLPEENPMKTSFMIRRDWLIQGELDNSEQMYQTYFDFMLDYGLAGYELPVFEDNAEAYVEVAKKYAADPRCGSYNMTYGYKTGNNVEINKYITDLDYEKLETYLKALIENSTPELSLLKKLYFYTIAIDEPDGSNRVPEANLINKNIILTLEKVASDYTSTQLVEYGLTKTDILKIEHVLTNSKTTALDGIRSFCPLITDFDSESKRASIDSYVSDTSTDEYRTKWWYTAWMPQYPYPSYHIDDNLISSRVLSWMQKDYGINGNLYWGTSNYVLAGGGISPPRDAYEDPISFSGGLANADGYLTYPGRKYGINGPVPSIRLESIRDGIEDYKYLSMLEDLLQENSAKYGKTFDYNKIMRSLYDSLYKDVFSNGIDENLVNARREVAGLIELLESDSKGIVEIDSINAIESKALVNIYADSESIVKVDGVELTSSTVSGTGKVFAHTVNLTKDKNYIKIDFTLNGKTYSLTKFVGKRSILISNFDTVEMVNLWEKTSGNPSVPKEHITVEISSNNAVSGNTLKAIVTPYDSGSPVLNALYSPSISISKQNGFSTVDPTMIDSIEVDIYNAGSEEVVVHLKLETNTAEKIVKKIRLLPGVNHVKVDQVCLTAWTPIKNTTKISFAFDNFTTGNNIELYFDNMFYTLNV